MPFNSPEGDENLTFMNRADQELYLVPSNLEELFEHFNESNMNGDDPMVIAKYYLPWTLRQWFATECERGVFFGCEVEGTSHEWKHFSIDDWNRISSVVGRNIIRDENFQRQRYSALSLRERYSFLNEVRHEVSSHAMDAVAGTSEIISFSKEIAHLKAQFAKEYYRSPELLNYLQQLWWVDTNDCGVIVTGVDTINFVENHSVLVTGRIIQSRKGYWLYGLSTMAAYGSGFGYAPNVYQDIWYKSKASAITAAKKEAENWLAKELAGIPLNEKLQHRQGIKKAIEELNSVQVIQMDLL